ncbi:MAG: hypothetical protein HYZ49_10135 [Chloroflexi bacterium]|nr:hypothetical protein [Chloroflexota bacterium]
MEEESTELDWRVKALIVGGIVGAIAGVGAAYLYIRNIEEAGQEPKLATKDAMTIGFSLVSLIKQIGNLGG